MNLEDDLRRALKRTDPPLDFANRVIAEVEREARRTPSALNAPARTARVTFAPVMRWMAAAATVAIVAAGAGRYYDYQQKVAEAKRVEAEIRLAMQITSDAFARVQQKLQDSNR